MVLQRVLRRQFISRSISRKRREGIVSPYASGVAAGRVREREQRCSVSLPQKRAGKVLPTKAQWERTGSSIGFKAVRQFLPNTHAAMSL